MNHTMAAAASRRRGISGETGSAPVNMRSRWLMPAMLTVLSIVYTLVLFGETTWSIVSIWWRSGTYAHGFIIFPVAAYLVWRNRTTLAPLVPQPSYGGLLLLAGAGLSWLLAHVVDVMGVQQAALVAMVPALVVTLLGWKVTWKMAFPLGFLFFAVPVGEGLVPPMMDFTAAFTVTLLRLTGIPIYWEGTFFSIPSADWSVVEGCSGVRYLIASVTLGVLYAYLTYRSLWRRLVFVALSVAVPIIANGLRAYTIVMIAHLSNMQLATGIDHFIYGWVFFGMVMLALFWVGSFWREEPWVAGTVASQWQPSSSEAGSTRGTGVAALLGLLMISLWPAITALLEGDGAVSAHPVALKLPQGTAGWHGVPEPIADWRPLYTGADIQGHQIYSKNGHRVGLHIAYYRTQHQGAELINSQNVAVRQEDETWRQVGRLPLKLSLAGQSMPVNQISLSSQQQRLLVWQWYWIGGSHTNNPYLAKLLEAKWRTLSGKRDAAGIMVYAEYLAKPGESASVLEQFLLDMLPSLEASLHGVSSD